MLSQTQSSKKPELLSPVGDWECLQAAVKNGADAVYLGVKEFNARLYTRNFTIEELGKVVSHFALHSREQATLSLTCDCKKLHPEIVLSNFAQGGRNA